MDDRFQSLYTTKLQLKKAGSLATVLMFIIVLLGIFGIVTFTLSSRTKEIAIRKVLGAKAANSVMLFIKEYALQIALANIIAWPLAFAITSYWLQGYAYRVEQNIFPFVLAAGFMLTAACILISIQCFKAAVANPVNDLRSEQISRQKAAVSKTKELVNDQLFLLVDIIINLLLLLSSFLCFLSYFFLSSFLSYFLLCYFFLSSFFCFFCFFCHSVFSFS